MSHKKRTDPSTSSNSRPRTAIDLYAGCGAVSEGLKRGGFVVVSAVDNDPIACRTYRANHPEIRLYESSIEKVEPTSLLEDLAGRELDLLVVCAPCQPFSSQNRNKGKDPRAGLIFESVRFAAALRPEVVFFENVPGLTTPRFRRILDRLRKELRKVGYTLGKPHRIDAADYRVPQRRVRCVMFASRAEEKLPLIPEPLSAHGNRVTVREAIGNIRRLKSGEADPSDHMHFARKHSNLALKRLSHIPRNGGDRFSLPDDLILLCHRNHRGHPDVYGRMCWEDVAPTLTTGCTDITRGRFAHPEDDRAITLREAATLQTFPGTYQFIGNSSQIATQIGNAVPVRLVEALCSEISKRLE